MSDYEQNPINGSQPPQGDSQPNTGYTPYQQPGTYYPPITTPTTAATSPALPITASRPVPLTIPPRHSPPARLTALPQSRRSRASRKKRRTKRPLPSW